GDRPAWADELDLVLTLHGQHWTGFVFNTFDQMATILEEVAGEVPGERILAYLPGWEGRYYWQYPVYAPGEDLGGAAGFDRLVDTSACWFDDPHHDLYEGYRTLIAVLRQRHPALLVCGEGWYDALLALFPMNQTWIESSEQPRFDELPMRYARLLGHLQEGAPG